MKISVIVATYNGQKYIIEQLESIKNQTRIPDEVLIFDDNSTDETVSIIESYIQENGLQSSWFLRVNNPGKGCVLNFMDGTKYVTGDIVFFCDQDDVWNVNKVKVMEEGFVINRDMLACYCLERYIDEFGNEIKSKFGFMHNAQYLAKGFTKVPFVANMKYNKCPGLCLATRKILLDELYPMIKKERLVHDLPVGHLASLRNGLYVINKKLVNYRQHSSNLSTPQITLESRICNVEYQIRGRLGRAREYQVFYNYYSKEMTQHQRELLVDAIKQIELSAVFLKNNDTKGLFRQLFHKNSMMNPWISLNNFLCALVRK